MRTMKLLAPAICMLALMAPVPDAVADGEVAVTVKPLHSLLVAIMGDTGAATLLLDNVTSVHDFNLKPSHIRTLQQVDAVFYVDDSFETFLASAFATMPDTTLKLAVARQAELELLPLRTGAVWHQRQAHRHGASSRSANAGTQVHDMHVWLDPRNARKIAEYMAARLGELYPGNAAIYSANAARLLASIGELDSELTSMLAAYGNEAFVVSHDAFQYFERAYGLHSVGAISIEPGLPPTASRLSAIRGLVKQRQVRCIFSEPQYPQRLIDLAAVDGAAQSAVLDPMGAALPPGATLYPELMRRMASAVRQCLGSGG